MTITVRNTLLGAGLLLCLLLLAGFLLAFAAAYSFQAPAGPLGRGVLVSLMALGGLLVYSLGAGLSLQRFFRKTVSSEMFFFIFFVISLSFESFKALGVLFQLWGLATYYGVIVARVVYFSRFFGVFCLLTSGLYATGIEYQKFEVVLGIAFLLAFTLSFSIPIDSSVFLPTLLYRIGGTVQLLAVFSALELFSILNFVLASILSRRREYLIMAGGLLLVIAGKDLLFFAHGAPAAVAAFAFLLAGTIVFGNRAHAIYLWT